MPPAPAPTAATAAATAAGRPHKAPSKHLYRLSDRTGKMTITEVTPVKRASLTSDDVYILDTDYQVFVWIGQKADAAERKNGLALAVEYLHAHNRPKTLPVTRLLEGGHNEAFDVALSA